MRFIVKFTNGYWKLFDAVQYREVDIFMLKTDADSAAVEANGNTPKQIRR